jgi:hypothetical protein
MNMNGLKPSMKVTKMQVVIDMDSEQISNLVFNELKETLFQFEEDMEKDKPGIFSMNEIYDKMQIQQHIDAILLLLEWYRVP